MPTEEARLFRVSQEEKEIIQRLRRGIAYLESVIDSVKAGTSSPIRPPYTAETVIAELEQQIADGQALLASILEEG